jgi:Na+/proline symporter
MFLVTSALIIMPDTTGQLLATGRKVDSQMILPTLVRTQMPFVMQVLFFGALLSAIKSTASATLLAPSVTFVENIWRQFFRARATARNCAPCASRCWCSASACCAYAILSKDKPIYEMVSSAYQVTLVGAFVPWCSGLY